MHKQFTDTDRRRLAAVARATRKVRLFRRVQAVLLVAEGTHSPAEAAHAVGASFVSVYAWCRAYLEGRHLPDPLAERPRTGRPRKAVQEVSDARLEAELARSPQACGYQSAGWTATLLATHLQRRFGGETLSPQTVRRRLKALGWRWKRGRYVFTPPKADLARERADPGADYLSLPRRSAALRRTCAWTGGRYLKGLWRGPKVFQEIAPSPP